MSNLLQTLHQRLGARLAPYRGADAPADYGDAAGEHAALRHQCGLVDRRWIGRIEMLGVDRARFLNGLVTCDVKALEAGQGAYGFVTDVKGRVTADLKSLALEDRLDLELPLSVADQVAEHLRKYVIVDRVEIHRPDDEVSLDLIGPRSNEVLADAGELPATDFGHRAARVCGIEIRLVREPALDGLPRWTLWAPVGEAERLVEGLLDHGKAHGLRPVGHLAFDRLRVAAGLPQFGLDFGPDNFPQETGLEETAVSYTKGCYLGQEVVARIHYRGGVNRHLRGLAFDDGLPGVAAASDLLGRSILSGGREAGSVTSAAPSPDGFIGLGVLHKRAEPGAEVDLAGGGTARVVELPFGSS